jgi:hypothetical protein
MKNLKNFLNQTGEVIRSTNQCFLPLLRSNPWLLLVLWVGCELLRQYFAVIGRLSEGHESLVIVAAFGDFTTSLVLYVALSLWAPLRVMEWDRKIPPQSFWAFTQRHVWPLTIESFRAMAVTLLWTLALIFPGLFKYTRLAFVPYVVVADDKYERGERDALEYSNALVKGITLPLFLILLLVLSLDLVQAKFRGEFPIGQEPLMALAIATPFFLVNVYANILLFRIYQLRTKVLTARSSI